MDNMDYDTYLQYMADINAEYARLLDKLTFSYLTISEHRRFRKIEKDLAMDKTETKLVTFFNPIFRKEPVFNPILEGIRQIIAGE